MKKEIIYACGSHCATPGYKSLCKYFDKIYILNECIDSLNVEIRDSDEYIYNFDDVECKYVFLNGYAKIITKEQLNEKIFINQHGSLLPKYRGMHSIFYAIMNGEKELGLTFHLVNELLDDGDILKQFSFDYNGNSIREIIDRCDAIIEKYAGTVIYEFINNKITPVKQDFSLATFGPKRNLNDCLVDFNMEHKYLRRFFAALNPPYPYPMLNIRGTKYEILDGYKILDMDYYGPIGRVVYQNDLGVWIKTKDGILIVDKVRVFNSVVEESLVHLVPIGFRF